MQPTAPLFLHWVSWDVAWGHLVISEDQKLSGTLEDCVGQKNQTWCSLVHITCWESSLGWTTSGPYPGFILERASWSGLKKSQGQIMAPEPGSCWAAFCFAVWTQPMLRLAVSQVVTLLVVKEVQSSSYICFDQKRPWV